MIFKRAITITRAHILLVALLFSVVVMVMPNNAQAQYPWCTGKARVECGTEKSPGAVANVSEYGPFLCDVCKATCIDQGQCSLDDIMIVTGNAGNFLLSIVGALALLLFVIGGLYLLTSGGNPERVKKGQKFFKGAIIGLVITFTAGLLLNTVFGVLRSGSVGTPFVAGDFVLTCSDENEGFQCADRKSCLNGSCQDTCALLGVGTPYGSRCVEEIYSGFSGQFGDSPADRWACDSGGACGGSETQPCCISQSF